MTQAYQPTASQGSVANLPGQTIAPLVIILSHAENRPEPVEGIPDLLFSRR